MTAQSVGQTLVGTGGNDTLSGGSANDVIWGDGLPVTVTDPFTLRMGRPYCRVGLTGTLVASLYLPPSTFIT